MAALFGIILQLIFHLDGIITNSLQKRAEESSSFELILIQNILTLELVRTLVFGTFIIWLVENYFDK